MKRLALVLAATAVLGTGCYVDGRTCSPSVTLEWDSHFTTADGAVVGCSSSSADVRTIDVWVNDQFAAQFDCFAARGTVAVPSGSSLVTVEGVDVSGRIIYRDDFSVDGGGCGNQLVATRPAEGRVNLDYSVSSEPPCANGPCFVWFSVFDNIAGEVAATINQNTAGFEYPNDVVFRLPAGSYTVDWMEIRSGGFLERAACTSPIFSVSPGSAPGEQQLVPSAPVFLKASCP